MKLQNKKIAIFIADYYEDLEFWYPKIRMQEEGAEVTVIGPEKGSFSGKKGMPAHSDIGIENADVNDFDALIIPGGYAPDHMRRSEKMVEFVKNFNKKNGPIAAICHAGWMLASAGILKDRKVTSFYSIKDDMSHSGATWVDQEVVQDKNVITSRHPGDLPAFCRKIIDTISA